MQKFLFVIHFDKEKEIKQIEKAQLIFLNF